MTLLHEPMASLSNPEPNVLELHGEIDLHESPRVRDALRRMLDQRPAELFIDLSGVTYIDSSGLATLIEAMQGVQAYGGQLALFGISENVRAIFHISRLDQVFRIFDGKTSAMAALS